MRKIHASNFNKRNNMKRNIPPLNSLKAFEAAARHLSFTRAANELCVTQGAISKQIKILEDFLGKILFKRIPGALLLTSEGKQYLTNIASSLDIIDKATNLMVDKKDGKNIFTINILPSLSTYWLIPHIGDFQKKNPDIIVRVITGDGFDIDFDSLSADVAIRSNNTMFKNLVNIPLIEEEMRLVCSPLLVKETEFDPKKITDYMLLAHTCRPHIWNEWMQKTGIENHVKNTLGFEHFFMLIEAAKKGLGFAFIPDFLVADEIKQGNLINPFCITHKTDFTYYLLYPERNKNNKLIKAFSTWLQR
jgi:LysR family transcriptional regulator, glycine cleavage system transcriptional activator